MEVTVIAKLRGSISFSDDALNWISRNQDSSGISKDNGEMFFRQNSEILNSTLVLSTEGEVRDYFREIGLPEDQLPSIRVSGTRAGSWYIDAVVTMSGAAGTVFSILKGISELPKIADDLSNLKSRMKKQFVKRANDAIVAGLRKNSQRAAPPSTPATIDLTIDTSPLTTMGGRVQQSMLGYTLQSDDRKEYLRRWGFKDAGHQDADPKHLQSCLAAVYDYYKQGTGSKQTEYQEKIAELTADIARLEKEIGPKREKVNTLRSEIDDIDINPRKYSVESEFSLFGLSLGSVLLFLLSIYLFVFYSSAIYSAFVRNLGQELQNAGIGSGGIEVLFSTIFDPNALAQASNAGAFAFFMTVLGPTVFITMGFLLHVLSKKQRYVKGRNLRVIALLLVVLFADLLIAYKITQGIYEAQFLTGIVDERWRFDMIWRDVNFYLVIVAGFASYIIWGVLLNYVMQEIDNMRFANAAKRKRLNEIKELEIDLEKKEQLKNSSEAESDRLQTLLSAQIMSWDDLSNTLDTYFSGWAGYVAGLFQDTNHPEALEKTKRAKDELYRYKTSIRSGLAPTGSVSTTIE